MRWAALGAGVILVAVAFLAGSRVADTREGLIYEVVTLLAGLAGVSLLLYGLVGPMSRAGRNPDTRRVGPSATERVHNAGELLLGVAGLVISAVLMGGIAATAGLLWALLGGVDKGAIKRRLLLDGLRGDINKLSPMLAGEEKLKLDHYLAAIEEFEKRQQGNPIDLSTCKVPSPAPADEIPKEGNLEYWMDTMNDMSVLAMVCGLTNVVGVAANNGGVHCQQGYERLRKGTPWAKLDGTGHSPDFPDKVPQMAIIHGYHVGLMASFAKALSGIKEGNGTAFDNALLVYTTDNGEDHHSDNWRWPMVVVGNGGGKIKADGRFLRYPSRSRSVRDFWATMAEGLGVPADMFGTPGNLQQIKGPLTEVLA